MKQPLNISDYEASKILREINRISYLREQDDPMVILNRRQDELTYYIGYLEVRGRSVKRINASPVVYVFIGSYQDPDRDTSAEYFIPGTGESDLEAEPEGSSTCVLSRFDAAIARLRGRLPAPKWDWNAEVRRFTAFLRSLSQERRMQTIQHMINVLSMEMEEEQEGRQEHYR